MIRCIIVEDEPLAAKMLTSYISRVPSLQLQATFRNALLAGEWLNKNETDLLFLDIHLPELKGTDFLKTLTIRPAVIITTAYNDYAVEGFDLNVTDYLLKPFDFTRFITAVNKIKLPVEALEEESFIYLKSERKTVKVLFSEIIYIESQREYIKIVTTEREYISRMSTNEIEMLLPEKLFRRIHRSYIISMAKVKSFTAESIEVTGITLPVGRGYRNVIDDL